MSSWRTGTGSPAGTRSRRSRPDDEIVPPDARSEELHEVEVGDPRRVRQEVPDGHLWLTGRRECRHVDLDRIGQCQLTLGHELHDPRGHDRLGDGRQEADGVDTEAGSRCPAECFRPDQALPVRDRQHDERHRAVGNLPGGEGEGGVEGAPAPGAAARSRGRLPRGATRVPAASSSMIPSRESPRGRPRPRRPNACPGGRRRATGAPAGASRSRSTMRPRSQREVCSKRIAGAS